MINTFRPEYMFHKRNTAAKHDWLGIHFVFCNIIKITVTIYGYGFTIGVRVYDVMKTGAQNNNANL